MLKLLARSKRTLTGRSATHNLTATQRLRQTIRRGVMTISAFAIACTPLLSLPATAQSSITGLSANSGSSVGGTEVTFDGELQASFVQVAASGYHSLGLTSAGQVYAWGDNGYGQLGDGSTVNRTTPTLVAGLSGQTIVSISAGSYHSLATTDTGALYAWGGNGDGQLGDGTATDRHTPTPITNLSGQNVVSISAGGYHSLATTATGDVYSWGSNMEGQLGDGTTTQRLSPTLVTDLDGHTFKSVSAGGWYHSLALTDEGTIYACGDNSSGQLGDGTTTNRSTPTLVPSLSNQTITAVLAGIDHSLALTNSGAVYAWGWNGYGQLGDGTTTKRNTPTLVTALSNHTVVAIGTGEFQSLALTDDATAYAWGMNDWSQLGDGTTTQRTTPTPIDTTHVIVHTPTVTFGGTPATGVELVDGPSGKQLKATAPAHSPGVVDVVISFPGEAPITLAGAYTYLPTTTVELSGITHPDPNGIAPALANGSLSAAGACNNITEPSVALLSPTSATAPADVSLYGGVGFSLDCTSNGDAATVSISLSNASGNATASLPAITSSNLANLRAYKAHSGTLTDITEQTTFSLGTNNTILVSYQLVDGGELDEDGVVNGTIVDPVYVGYYLGGDTATNDNGTLAETGSNVFWPTMAGIVLILVSAIFMTRRPRAMDQ